MEIDLQIVDFAKHCATCKYEKLEDTEQPCCECMEEPVNLHSEKPVKWKAKEK